MERRGDKPGFNRPHRDSPNGGDRRPHSDGDRRDRFGGPPRGPSRGPPRGSPRGSHGSRPDNRFFLHKGSIVYILDILQHGRMERPDQASQHHSFNPICQILEVPSFHLFEIEMNKGATVAVQDKVIISGEDGPLGRVTRRLQSKDLTSTSQDMLKEVLVSYVKENETFFVDWFNKAGPITIKRHSLEVLPGIGKKIMWDIVNERTKKLFANYADMSTRIPGLKPSELIAKRIVEELESDEEKHYLFVKKAHPTPDGPQQSSPSHQFHPH